MKSYCIPQIYKRCRTPLLTLQKHFENRPSTRLNFLEHLQLSLTLFRSYNQFYRAECITVYEFAFLGVYIKTVCLYACMPQIDDIIIMMIILQYQFLISPVQKDLLWVKSAISIFFIPKKRFVFKECQHIFNLSMFCPPGEAGWAAWSVDFGHNFYYPFTSTFASIILVYNFFPYLAL